MFLLSNCKKPNPPEILNRCTGGYEITEIFKTPGYLQDIVKKENICYLAQGEGGLLIVDVKTPEIPQILSILNKNVRGYSRKITIKDTTVYIAAGSYGVTAVNVANPDNPEVTHSNLSIKPGVNCYVAGNYLFAAISERGVKVSELSNPGNPDIRGTTDTYGYAQGLCVSSDNSKMFVACGEMGLSVFDISNFDDGYGTYPLLAWCDTPGYAEAVAISEKRHLAFMACGTAGLQIIDFSDINNVHITGSYDTDGYAKEIIFDDNKVYMTTEEKGTVIFNVKNAETPELTGTIQSRFALGLELDDNFIYIADKKEGLIIISKPKPTE